MSLTLILNVLIGLVLTWFLLSLAAMNIQEWLATRGNWRPEMLEKTIGKMLTDIVLPAALPSIFAGLRIAVGSAWMLTVTAEMVAVSSRCRVTL